MTPTENVQADLRVVVPSDALVTRYIERLELINGELTTKKVRIEQDRQVNALFLAEALSPEVRDIYTKRIEQSKSDITRLERHRSRIDELLKEARDASQALFLPIGAIVVSKENYNFSEDDWGLTGSRPGPQPQKGTKGVVVGFNERDDWAVKVVFFEDVMDADEETTWHADRDGEPLLIPFHAKDLEVLSLATFVDGSPCRCADFIQTHVSKDDDEETATMIVISGGVPIEITAYNIEDGNPWYQDAKSWADLEPLKDFEPYDGGAIEATGPAL